MNSKKIGPITVFEKILQKDPRLAAVDHALAVDQYAVLLHPVDRLLVADDALVAELVIRLGRRRHELQPALGDRVGRLVDVLGAHGDVLDALAIVPLEVLDDLPLLRPILVDRNPDTSARGGQGTAVQAGKLALDVEKPDLFEVEDAAIEVEPHVHVALVDVVREVIEVVEADTLGMRLGDPVELSVIGRGLVIVLDEVDQATADPDDRGYIHRLAGAGILFCALRDGVLQSVAGIDDAPRHGRRAGSVFVDEGLGVAARLIVQDVGDVALLPDLDRLRPVRGDEAVPHAREQFAQLLRLGVCELHEFEAVGPGGILPRDLGFRCVVREWTHETLHSNP